MGYDQEQHGLLYNNNINNNNNSLLYHLHAACRIRPETLSVSARRV
jgi:hypothetical protein